MNVILLNKKSTHRLDSVNVEAIVLEYSNWNDYGYYTSYNAFYYDLEQNKNSLGCIKVYNKKMDLDDYGDKKVGSYFEEDCVECLTEDFCSLGQSVEYYNNFNKYFGNNSIDVLNILRDMAVDDVINEDFFQCRGVRKSLLRTVAAQKALAEAKSIFDKYNGDEFEDYATIDVQTNQSGEEIYPYSAIKIERNQFSIYEIKRKYEKQRLYLDPSFQRHFVWSLKQQSELIESVIMGIPLPLVYLAENRDGQLVVVDGRQRLTTFIRFLDNKFRLSRLSILTELNGKNYAELDCDNPNYISTIEDYQLVVQVIKYPTPDRIRFDIFDRVNRGGTPLNKQEMRNALYQGKATALLRALAECQEFKDATGDAISDRHMKDQYIVLRALAFTLVFCKRLKDKKGNIVEYKSDMDDLMAKTMEYLNSCDEDEIHLLEKDFKSIMNRSYEVLGRDAFRVKNENGRKRPISMTLFETIYYMLFLMIKQGSSDEDILDVYEKLSGDEVFMDAVQYSVDSSRNVDIRFTKVREYTREDV